MTRLPGLDPEVLADLRAREASEGDRDRSRETALAFGDPTPVEHWPCRGCPAMVGMTRDALELHDMFNRQLWRRRQPQLPKRGLCDACRKRELVAGGER